MHNPLSFHHIIMYHRILIIAAVLSVIVSSCSHSDRKLWPYGWTREGEPFDSVTLVIERLYRLKAPVDSLQPLADRMRQLADEDPTSKVKDVRARYWLARLKMKQGDYDGALEDMGKALSMCDSSKYPYDARRIKWNMDIDYHPLTAERYQNLLDDAVFFEKEGDMMLAGALYTDLGNMMENLGSSYYATEYYDRADSLFAAGEFDEQVRNNRINRALIECRINRDTIQGEKILRQLAADPDIQSTPEVYDIVLGDLYSLCNDTASLRKGYNIVRNNPSQQYAQALYEAFLTEEALKKGQIDSAFHYSNLGIVHAAESEDLEVNQNNYRARAQLMATIGRNDSAYQYLLAGDRFHDSMCVHLEQERVLNIETIRQIGEKKLAIEHAQSHQTIMMAIGIFAAIIIGLLVAAYFYRRMHLQKVASMKASLELEQSQRRVMAMQLGMQEKDNLLSSVSREMADLTAKGEISQKAGSRIESSIKTHIGSQHERDNFIETFSSLNPDFSDRLKADYPGLTDADVRLAAFIALGLENKHIARIMSIRPESVKQARWRLRQRMGLKADTSLEQAISRYLA